jgi:antitoxin MazE
MNTITIEVNKQSNEWIKLTSFVETLGLSIKELEPTRVVRAGWAEAAKRMHECGDDELLINDVFEDEVFEP